MNRPHSLGAGDLTMTSPVPTTADRSTSELASYRHTSPEGDALEQFAPSEPSPPTASEKEAITAQPLASR